MSDSVTLRCPNCGQRNRVATEAATRRTRCGACKQELPLLDEPLPLNVLQQLEELVAASELPVLVDFWAGWCGPCQMVAPEVAKLAQRRAGALVVAKADTEADPAFSVRFGIRGIPAFVLFAGGRELGRFSGAVPVEGLEQFVDQTLARSG